MKNISPIIPLVGLACYCLPFLFGSPWIPWVDIPVITLAIVAIPVFWYAGCRG